MAKFINADNLQYAFEAFQHQVKNDIQHISQIEPVSEADIISLVDLLLLNKNQEEK